MDAAGSSEAGRGVNEEPFPNFVNQCYSYPEPETDKGTTVYPNGTQNRNVNVFIHFAQPAYSVLSESFTEGMSSLAVRGW